MLPLFVTVMVVCGRYIRLQIGHFCPLFICWFFLWFIHVHKGLLVALCLVELHLHTWNLLPKVCYDLVYFFYCHADSSAVTFAESSFTASTNTGIMPMILTDFAYSSVSSQLVSLAFRLPSLSNILIPDVL